MQLWPLPLEFTEFKLPVKLMLSQGIHLAPVREGIALANLGEKIYKVICFLGFSHFYRVNYDLDSWRSILEMLTQVENDYSYYMRIERDSLHQSRTSSTDQ